MTESEWLTSDDPSEMYAFIRDHVTEKQMRFFVEACRKAHNLVNPHYGWGLSNWSERFDEWCLHCWGDLKESVPFAMRADLLREIIGNPFRLMRLEHGTQDKHLLLTIDNIHWPLGEWLTWNDGTIGHMVQAILEKPCPFCNEEPDDPLNHSMDCTCGHKDCPAVYLSTCEKCKSGYIPRAEPRWADMPILADALEEARCSEAAILEHLRGEEKCPWCPQEPDEPLDHSTDCSCGHKDCPAIYLATCDHCNGSGKRSVTHHLGCWCLELLKGKES